MNFWKKCLGFHLDGVSFTHNMNPFDQVIASRALTEPGETLRKTWIRT